MFSAYPDRWPGLGLLLLRAAVGSVLMIQGFKFYQEEQGLRILTLTMAVVTALVGVLVCIGLLARFATAVAALGTLSSIFSWIPAPKSGLLENRSTALLALVIAAAITAAGPGAFSLDARLFGRREIIIPKNHDDNRVQPQ